ncbi:hypothetical protein [Sorangium sp. So ce1000]|uniref:hypothetical protein n=1 Tax=Sorangium sp. So ce1000 TaxID=3133325 RepID=UPI003F63FAE1
MLIELADAARRFAGGTRVEVDFNGESTVATKHDESAVSNAGVDGEAEDVPMEHEEKPWEPLKRKPRTFTYEVARSADGEPALNTIDLAPHFELSF